MLVDLVEQGLKLFTCRTYRDKDAKLLLDGTNNVTEQAIGWSGKIRHRQMRGANSRRGFEDFLDLNAFLWEGKFSGAPTFHWGP